MSEQESGGIKVTDKRRFTEEGERREVQDQAESEVKVKEEPKSKAEEPSEKQTKVKAKVEAKTKVEAEVKVEEKQKGETQELPSIDFVTFILSLASSVQVHLGLIPNPGTGKPEKNMGLAKQTVDILGVLQEKTKGNLEKEEERLLEGILYDLRMKYVELNK